MRMILDLDHLQEIVHALSRNRLRTALTAFGVSWGLFLLVIMLAGGSGIENGTRRDFEGTATNSFFIWTQRTTKPWRGLPRGRSFDLTSDDVIAVKRAIPEVDVVSPRSQLKGYGGGVEVVRGTRSAGLGVMGDTPDVLLIEPVRIVKGRFLDPLDVAERRKVAVIGPRGVEVLFAKGEDPIGEGIRIKGVEFKVVGVFEPRRTGDDRERDASAIYVPITTFQRAFNQGENVGWLSVTSREGVPAAATEEKVLALLKSRHQVAPDDARALGHWNMGEEYDKIRRTFAGVTMLVWIVGIGTLAAGVIGVSNILLVIVKERTREIGIRRALGATPFTIASQVVLEAVILTALAGYAGLVAGIALVEAARPLIARSGAEMFVNPDVSIGSLLLAVLVLVVSGALAGLLPADRALRTSTVEALRA